MDVRHLRSGGGAGYQLHLAGGGLLTYIDAVRDAYKVGIFKFDAGALVSVIQQHVDAGGVELGGDLLAVASRAASATLVTVTTR